MGHQAPHGGTRTTRLTRADMNLIKYVRIAASHNTCAALRQLGDLVDPYTGR
ncbi:hypothetical protein BDR05DRAFT_967702 [Suillus weaverae]|nr:hypothetical protein BDR05DRAFT_967702 [Suillus weaverae]